MKKLRFLQRLFLIVLLGLPLAMAGCSGDDGATGPQGPQGPPGPGTTNAETCAVCHKSGAIADVAATDLSSAVHPGLVAPQELSATIDSFTVTAGFATTTFTVKDANGNGVTGLAVASASNATRLQYVRIAYAQLEPDPTTTNPATGATGALWVGLNRNDRNFGELTDNGSGSYTYVSTVDISATYDPTFLTRVLLIVEPVTSLNTDALNVVKDVPGTGTALSREIVTTDACDACHGRLGSPLSGNLFDVPDFHGGDRYLATACVVCHTSTLGDATANGNGEAEFGPMIHKIHDAKTFTGIGDFSDVTYPQEIRNCTTCHQGGADSDNYQNFQNVQNCFLSCHDTTVVTGFNHATSVVPNDTACASCHGPTGANIAPVLDIPAIHAVFAETQSGKFHFNIVDTSFDTTSRELSVIYSVTDPTNADTPYVLNGTNADFAWTQGSNSRLFIDIAFPPQEISNEGSGQDVGQPISVNGLAGTDNLDGTYTVTATIPAGVTAVTVAMEGHPAATDPADNSIARIPVTCPTTDVSLDGNPATPRRAIVDITKCDKCHFQLSLHGNNRTDNIGLCVLCHNPNATDVDRRGGIAAADAPDGKTQQAIDFKVMIHGIHQASGITVYGFSGTPNVFDDVTFPGILSNCETCHFPGTFGVPLKDEVLDTTTDVGTDPVDPTDNLRTTKTTSVCSSCHTDTATLSHMLSEGGHQNLTEEEIQALQ